VVSERKRINDATLRGLKPAPKGKRYEVWDDLKTGFGVRVTDKGTKSFIVYTRFNGAPTRRWVGDATKMSVREARKKAENWLELAEEGRDPKAEERAAKAAEAGRETFAHALEEYIRRHVTKTRRAKDTERELRNNLLTEWKDRPLEEITKADVRKVIEKIAGRGAERQAHNILSLAKTFFAWAEETDRINTSPCASIKPKKLIGEKRVRTRVLDDAELRAVWKAAEATPYPYGPYVRLLLLTGARKTEASDAAWSEFPDDLEKNKAIWTVPEERFKSGVTHRVPLSKDAVALLRDLPRWPDSNLVFSYDGEKSMNCYSRVKARLDGLVNLELGRECNWQIHDLRRTVRTRLASLGVADKVAEAVIGHGRKGLARVYDQHEYEPEMREALERWAARLRDIVTPPPKNDTDLEEKRRARA
jgi:integrase